MLALVLLAGVTLGGQARSRSSPIVVQTVAVGHLPDALALDPGADRAIVASDAAATVSLLDLAARRVLRTVTVSPPGTVASLALALDPRTHHLFVVNRGDDVRSSVVRLLDSRSGALLALLHVGPGADGVAVDEQTGHVLVASAGDGRVSLLSARTGRLLHTTRVGLEPLALAVDPRTARAFVLGTVPLPPAEPPAGAQVGLVGVLDTRTGALVRTVVVGYGPAALALDGRTARVFVANNDDDTVSMLDAHTGGVLWTVRVGRAPAALAVDARDRRVFVANEEEGMLSVLDARTGALVRTVPVVPGTTARAVLWSYALAVDAARARVYVTAWGQRDQAGPPPAGGQLAVVDARAGALLHTMSLGVAPQAVAVQEDNGRVVVVDSGGLLPAAPDGVPQWLGRVVGRVPGLERLVPRPPAAARVPGSVRVLDPRGL